MTAPCLRSAGWSDDQIARELGVAKSSCSLWLRDLPHPVRDAPQSPAAAALPSAPERRARARRLRAAGALLSEIASEQGVTVTTASRWCADLPAPPRSRRGGSPEHVAAMAGARWTPFRLAPGRAPGRRARGGCCWTWHL